VAAAGGEKPPPVRWREEGGKIANGEEQGLSSFGGGRLRLRKKKALSHHHLFSQGGKRLLIFRTGTIGQGRENISCNMNASKKDSNKERIPASLSCEKKGKESLYYFLSYEKKKSQEKGTAWRRSLHLGGRVSSPISITRKKEGRQSPEDSISIYHSFEREGEKQVDSLPISLCKKEEKKNTMLRREGL